MAAPLTTTSEAILVRDVARSFGPVRALAGVSFSLRRGEALAVFGPNGAGKTTLLRLLAGVLHADRGEIAIMGRRLSRGDVGARRHIGLISHASLLYDGLTAAENLTFYARLYGLADPAGKSREALAAVGLSERATSPAGTMSRGMLQRLAIARALLHQPEVVLLDEPFTGLDQRAAAALTAQLARLRDAGRAVVLVTHDIAEGLELATHAAILSSGRLVESGPRSGDLAAYRRRYAEATDG